MSDERAGRRESRNTTSTLTLVERPNLDDIERMNQVVLEVFNALPDRSAADATRSVLSVVAYARHLEGQVEYEQTRNANNVAIADARIAALTEALRPLADFAYRFVAYPQGLAGRDPLMGILKHDVETLRLLAKHGADALIDKPVTREAP